MGCGHLESRDVRMFPNRNQALRKEASWSEERQTRGFESAMVFAHWLCIQKTVLNLKLAALPGLTTTPDGQVDRFSLIARTS